MDEITKDGDKVVKFKKYTKGEKRALVAAIKRLAKEGIVSRDEMVTRLKADGFTGPGGKPLARIHVQSTIQRQARRLCTRRPPSTPIRRRASAPRTQTAAPASTSDATALFELVLDSNMEPEKKIEMLKLLNKKGK